MEIQQYHYRKNNNNHYYFVIVRAKSIQIIYHGYKEFKLNFNYIKQNFNGIFNKETHRLFPIFENYKDAKRFMEYLKPLIEPYLVMEKLLGG